MKSLYTAIVTSIGGRSGSVKSSDGVIDLEIRPPKGMGGPHGAYSNPEQLFAAGYSACFGSSLSFLGLQRGLRIKPIVTAKVHLMKNEPEGFRLAVDLDVVIPGISQKDAEILTDEAHQYCPYSIAIRNNVEVKINVNTDNLM